MIDERLFVISRKTNRSFSHQSTVCGTKLSQVVGHRSIFGADIQSGPRAFGPVDHARKTGRGNLPPQTVVSSRQPLGKLHYRKRASTPDGYSGYKGCCGISFRVEAPVTISLLMACHQACQLDSVAVMSWYIALRLLCRRG